MRSGLGHIGNTWKMISRANCEDGFWDQACTKSFSLENLSKEVEDEIGTNRDLDKVNANVDTLKAFEAIAHS